VAATAAAAIAHIPNEKSMKQRLRRRLRRGVLLRLKAPTAMVSHRNAEEQQQSFHFHFTCLVLSCLHSRAAEVRGMNCSVHLRTASLSIRSSIHARRGTSASEGEVYCVRSVGSSDKSGKRDD
jgi:hypothetical protein